MVAGSRSMDGTHTQDLRPMHCDAPPSVPRGIQASFKKTRKVTDTLGYFPLGDFTVAFVLNFYHQMGSRD